MLSQTDTHTDANRYDRHIHTHGETNTHTQTDAYKTHAHIHTHTLLHKDAFIHRTLLKSFKHAHFYNQRHF